MDLTDTEIIQVNISGYDKPGLTTSLTDILAKYDAFILDIGQARWATGASIYMSRKF